MELVVVNGASNISKRVIEGLIKGGQYRKVRLLDFKPFHQHVYTFQRELNQQGIEVDKRITTNGAALDIALEGASNVVYFTHDYTSLVSCKNNFLIGAAKLSKKHGVKSMVAVLPVEHDMAYTEVENKTWVQVRQEAEQTALQSGRGLTLLNTDLVYSEKPTHLLHYVAQRVAKGSIRSPFLSDASFRPVHSDDLAKAVAHVLHNGIEGHFAVRGSQDITIKELVSLIEKASGKGTTSGSKYNPLILIEEFFSGLTVDQNLVNLVKYFEDNKSEVPVTGQDFWASQGISQEHDVRSFYSKVRIDQDKLALPSLGDYKLPHLNF